MYGAAASTQHSSCNNRPTACGRVTARHSEGRSQILIFHVRRGPKRGRYAGPPFWPPRQPLSQPVTIYFEFNYCVSLCFNRPNSEWRTQIVRQPHVAGCIPQPLQPIALVHPDGPSVAVCRLHAAAAAAAAGRGFSSRWTTTRQ